MSHHSSYRLHFRLALSVVLAACVVTLAGYYLVCLVAIQTAIALGRGCNVAGGRRTHAASDGLAVGVATAAAWSLCIAGIVTAALGSYAFLPYVLAAALPAAIVIGWRVGEWQAAVSWSRSPGCLVLGDWRSGRFFVRRPYTVTAGERNKHLVCSGPTGSGKSTLVRNLILQDLKAGGGLCVIDPKDDLIDGVLPHVPDERLEDVILFDITDRDQPLGFNPFAGVAADQRSLATSELIAVFRRYFADAWGARLEHVLRNVVLALLETPGATLLDVPRLLLDRNYCARVIAQVSNPAVREFFLYEYEEVLRRRGDAIEPILNKVGPWLSYPELRDIIGQPVSSFDLRQVMDGGKVLFVRIPQGAFGEDISNLLGALIVAKLQLAAQSRVNQPVQARRPFALYVDEFQNFATSSFTKIATEARAFGLGIVAVNQYSEQLSRELQLALSRNAATFVQAGYRKGRYLIEVTRQEDLKEKHPQVYVVTPPPPLPASDPARVEQLRTLSRQRYGRRPLLQGETASAGPRDGEIRVVSASRDVDEE